jgi:hypothetical protein
VTPPNMRVQRTRSSASPPHSPLTRGPLGGVSALGLVALAAAAACAHSMSTEERMISRSELSAQRARASFSSESLTHFVPIALTASQESAIKHILITASQRERKTSLVDSEGMSPGVYGCVTSSYLLTFKSEGREVQAAFHECGPGWIGFANFHINLEGEEQYRLAAILDVAPVRITGNEQ